MFNRTKTVLCSDIVALLVFLLVSACQSQLAPANSTLELPSGKEPNASVSGSVTYRERIALSPDAKLVVEIRDVSYQDAAAPLIARQTISDPGQVPIEYKVGYNRDDIDSRSIYSVSARIVESDGRLAFTNDTAHDVITRGNPNNVDMVLVLVQPPPDTVGDKEDWRTWVEVPARVIRANLIPNEREQFLRIEYYQSTIEGCARRGSKSLQVNEYDIVATVTLMQPPQTSWAIPCDDEMVQLDEIQPIVEPLEPARTYRVIVNDQVLTTLTVPDPELGYTHIAESPIENAEIRPRDGASGEYELLVVSGLSKGSSCWQFNGYEIRRSESDTVEVTVTHHEVSDPMVACTADYPIVETTVPLGPDLEPGVEYTVVVNSDISEKFVAQ